MADRGYGSYYQAFCPDSPTFCQHDSGHIVIIILPLSGYDVSRVYLVGVGSVSLSLIIYLLELLVAFIQGIYLYILSAMFIGSSSTLIKSVIFTD
jgi:hypothetical protein